MASKPEEAPVERSWGQRNALALLALAPVLVAAARVLVFSGGDPAVLATVVRGLDIPAVVLASLGSTLGLIVGYTLYVVIANRHVTPVGLRWFRGASPLALTLLLILVLGVVWLSPLQQLLMVAAFILLGVVFRVVSGVVDRRRGTYVPADVPAIAAVIVFALLGNMSGTWMPAEVVGLDDGSSRVAYVVGTSDGWVTTIGVHDMAVELVPSAEIASRHVCDLTAQRSLSQILNRLEPQPLCPDVGGPPSDEPSSPSG